MPKLTSATPKFVGNPDGPKVFVPELGWEVGTFTKEPGGKHPALRHHVPVNCRGPFRADQLANYDASREYRCDSFGFVLCYETNKDGNLCKRKAVNRSPYCNFHGGRVHPLDKLVDPEADIAAENPGESLSRYQQYLAKQISTEDLDDDEIMNFGFRDEKTGRIFKPRNISRDMVNAFTKAMYDRALTELKSSALEAAKTLATIMNDPAVDAPVRVKAAEAILDRTLGKAPQVVAITGTAPWEEVFEGIAPITREESRRRRGIVVEGEVVGEDGQSDQPSSQPAIESSTEPTKTILEELLGD